MSTIFTILVLILFILAAIALIIWIPTLLMAGIYWLIVELPSKIAELVKSAISSIFSLK